MTEAVSLTKREKAGSKTLTVPNVDGVYDNSYPKSSPHRVNMSKKSDSKGGRKKTFSSNALNIFIIDTQGKCFQNLEWWENEVITSQFNLRVRTWLRLLLITFSSSSWILESAIEKEIRRINRIDNKYDRMVLLRLLPSLMMVWLLFMLMIFFVA